MKSKVVIKDITEKKEAASSRSDTEMAEKWPLIKQIIVFYEYKK